MAQSPLGVTSETYLRNRGISHDTLTRFGVDQVGSVNCLKTHAVGIWGLERVKDAGLISNASTQSHLLFDFSDDQILFPCYRSGHCEYFQARRIDHVRRFRWVNPRNVVKRLYNLDALSSVDVAEPVYLCEGVTDFLSAHEFGWTAIGVPSVRLPHAEWLPHFRNRSVRVVFDDDDAGRNMAANYQRQLEAAGIEVATETISFGRDLNEFLVQGTR